MKAVEYLKYGAPEELHIIEVQKPTPKDNEVLVKIHATTVTATEAYFRQGISLMTRLFTGLLKPKLKRLGEEFSGTIERVGKDVHDFAVGDKVFGTAGPEFGANAEYLCVEQEGVITHLPQDISFEDAAGSIDGFLTALPFLRDTGAIKAGQKVLIYGASGSVGSSAIQVAKLLGAEVHGVCSAPNKELVLGLGATKVYDYTTEDFTKMGEKYDIIFDSVGKTSFSRCKSSLTEYGVFLEAGFDLPAMGSVLTTKLFGKKKSRIAATGLRKPEDRVKDLIYLKKLMENQKIVPVIDRTYSLETMVEAHTYVDTGRKKGNVVIAL